MNDGWPSKATSKPYGLTESPIYSTEANKKLQKDIYYFIAVIFLLNLYLRPFIFGYA
jgi:hypothetical protein